MRSSYCMADFHIERFLIYFLQWVKSRLNFKIYQPIVLYVRCNDVTQTRKLENQSGTEVLQMQQNANMNLYTLNSTSSGAFEFEERKKQAILKNRSR